MPDGQDVAYTRYVAIGDSQTEGLWDGNDSGEIVGFADRLAAMLDSLHPGLQYANLAIPAAVESAVCSTTNCPGPWRCNPT